MTITIYTKPDCMQCAMSYQQLIEKGVDFDIKNVTVDTKALEQVKGLGYSQAPVIVAEDEHWGGFVPSKIDELVSRISESGAALVSYERTFARQLVQDIKDLLKNGERALRVANGEIVFSELELA